MSNRRYGCRLHDIIGGSTYVPFITILWSVEKLANIWYPGQQLAFYLIYCGGKACMYFFFIQKCFREEKNSLEMKGSRSTPRWKHNIIKIISTLREAVTCNKRKWKVEGTSMPNNGPINVCDSHSKYM